VQKRAQIAEARSSAEAAIRAAGNRQETEVSRLEADLGKLKADAARRITDAQTRGTAMVAEAKGQVAARLARAQAELDVQRARVEQVRRQLQADVLEPARARKAAAEADAKGQASRIVEQGRATASAMEEIASSWRRVGGAARQVFLMQKVDGLMRIVMGTVGDLRVDRLTMLGGTAADGADGGGDGAGAPLTNRLLAASEQLKAATGVDLLRGLAGRLGQGVAPTTTAPAPVAKKP
jgi:flotillin